MDDLVESERNMLDDGVAVLIFDDKRGEQWTYGFGNLRKMVDIVLANHTATSKLRLVDNVINGREVDDPKFSLGEELTARNIGELVIRVATIANQSKSEDATIATQAKFLSESLDEAEAAINGYFAGYVLDATCIAAVKYLLQFIRRLGNGNQYYILAAKAQNVATQ